MRSEEKGEGEDIGDLGAKKGYSKGGKSNQASNHTSK